MYNKNSGTFYTSHFLALTSILFLLIGFSSSVKAQDISDHRFGIAVNGGYDVPVGNLGYTFKPATTYGFTVLSYHGNITTSVSFGYQAYKPKQDTFYYQIDASNYGTIRYQNYTAYSLYLGVAYNFKLSDTFKLYAGLNFGDYLTHSVYSSSDEFVNSNSDFHDNNFYVAPKLGLNYTLSGNFSVGIEGKYNTFILAGQKSDDSRVGTVYSSYAGNLFLTYNF